MPPPRRQRLRWVSQVGLVTAVLIVGTVGSALTAALLLARRSIEQQSEAQALSIAQTVAIDPRFADWVVHSQPSPDGPAQAAAEEVRLRTKALYVVVTDTTGIRYSHPSRAEVGRMVSTDPAAPLAGQEVTLVERGTLGLSARGKVPLRDPSGHVVGTVSVGIGISQVEALQQQFLLFLTAVTATTLAVGLLAVAIGSRRLSRITHHLEPDEMADLLREHAALLGGAQEGVVAADSAGYLRVANPAARLLLGTSLHVGSPVTDCGLPAPVADLLTNRAAPDGGSLLVVGDRILQTHRLEVERTGHDLGSVVVLADRTDLDVLGRELEATRALTDVLRGQAHEYTHRLHALLGLLHLGHVDEALEYLADLSVTGTGGEGVEDPYLQGILAAKTAVADEMGVDLRIGGSTWVEGRLLSPLDAVTVVGNLIDNATRAASAGTRPPWVEVCLVSDGSDLLVHVIDSGPGVGPEQQQAMFSDGWTTKTEHSDQHGIGLSLARATARRHGGYLELAVACGPDHGAAFRARLCRVLSPKVPVKEQP
ncbi:MAG: ATP-binding protein [Actinomycetia bacterium]|nr:ATP-binding protein [Actinomycetes bacterium]